MEQTKTYQFLQKIAEKLRTGQGRYLVARAGHIYGLEIISGNETYEFTINLKYGDGSIDPCKVGEPDVTWVMTDDLFAEIISGQQSAEIGFLTGKIKVKGDMTAAMKFAPENLSKL